MSKKCRFRGSFEKQYDKSTQALFKSASQHLYNIHWSLPSQLSWKRSLLLTCQILELLVNTLPTNEKYSVLNIDNSTILIQMQLSQRKNTFPTCPSTVKIRIAASLSNSLIPAMSIESEKVSLIDLQNLRTAC